MRPIALSVMEIHFLVEDTHAQMRDRLRAAQEKVARQLVAIGIDPASVEIVTQQESSEGRIGFRVWARLKDDVMP